MQTMIVKGGGLQGGKQSYLLLYLLFPVLQ